MDTIKIKKIDGFPAVVPDPDRLPTFVNEMPCAVWVAEPKDGQPGKFNKAPRNPNSGIKVGANNPGNFGTCAEALKALYSGRYSGLGVLLDGSGITGVDIDNYLDTFATRPEVKAWVENARQAGAYCEQSPSGKGLRLFVRGHLPGNGRKAGPLEIYDDARYLTITGKRVKGCEGELIDGQNLIDEFLAMLPKEDEAAPHKESPGMTVAADPAIVERLASLMAEKDPLLMAGKWDTAGGLGMAKAYPSQSEADMALVGTITREAVKLGVLAEALADTVMTVFERSGLYRPEKHRAVADYAIPKAIAAAMAERGKGSDFPTATVATEKLPRLALVDGLIQFSDELPAPRDFTIQDLILAAKACLLAGLGGVSKSQLLMQMAVCVALGQPFMGMATAAGCVLLLMGEEDAEEIGRRFNAIAKVMKLTAAQIEIVRCRVRAYPMIKLDMRLTKMVGSSLEADGFVNEILEAASQLEAETKLSVRLIGLDHLGLLHGGDFNAREDAVQTMRQINYLAQESGAAVVVLAHSPKNAIGADKSDAGHVAGSAAFVDHSRAALILRTMGDDDGKRYGVERDERKSFVSLAVVKGNYIPTGGEVWMQRRTVEGYEVSVLHPVMLKEPVKEPKGSNVAVRASILDLIREKPCMTKHALEGFAGVKDGRIRASKAHARTEVESMLAEGLIVFRQPTTDERTQLGIKGPTAGFLTVAQG